MSRHSRRYARAWSDPLSAKGMAQASGARLETSERDCDCGAYQRRARFLSFRPGMGAHAKGMLRRFPGKRPIIVKDTRHQVADCHLEKRIALFVKVKAEQTASRPDTYTGTQRNGSALTLYVTGLRSGVAT